MAPKRPVEVITLSDSDDDQPAPPPRRRKKSSDESLDQQIAQAMALSLSSSEDSLDQDMVQAMALSFADSEASNGRASTKNSFGWLSLRRTSPNVLYIHDFPRRSSFAPSEKPTKNPTHTSFSRKLLVAVERLSLPPKSLGPFRKFDFSTSAEVQLVVSVQGMSDGWDEVDAAGGMASMARAVKALGFSPGGKWEIEATGSSMGRCSYNWLNNMLAAAYGIHPKKYFKDTRSAWPNLPPIEKMPIKIIFPTLEEADASPLGRIGGHSVIFPKQNWANFPHHLFYRSQSKHQGVPAHTKMIVAWHRPGRSPSAEYKPEGWIYVGSHNFTPAAWGHLQSTEDRGLGIAISNFELGVILPIRGGTMNEVEEKASALASYRRPLVPYAVDDVPFMQGLHKVFAD